MWRTLLNDLIFIGLSALVCGGCGDSAQDQPLPGTTTPGVATKRVKFVGFDASPPLVESLKRGKLQGLVVQNPLRMGELGLKAAVAALEKQAVEPRVSTGETLVTPDNMTSSEVMPLLNPPKTDHAANANASGSRSKKWRVMVIPKGTTHEFWKTIHAGALKAAEELGNVEVIWQGPQKEDDRSLQIQYVQSAVATGVDALVLAPLDAKALKSAVEGAVAKGIPVVIIDSSLESDKPVSYVATDNYHGGVLAAERLGELLNGEGKIILMRYAVGSASTDEREKGFTDTISKTFPRITYLSNDQYAGATADQAQKVAQSLITRFRGQVDGVFCPNESSTLGMLRALDAAGMLESKP